MPEPEEQKVEEILDMSGVAPHLAELNKPNPTHEALNFWGGGLGGLPPPKGASSQQAQRFVRQQSDRPRDALKLVPTSYGKGESFWASGPSQGFNFLDNKGGIVGGLSLSPGTDATNMRINWVSGTRTGLRSIGESNSLGLSVVRDLKNQLKQMYPNLQTLSGFRISGARGEEPREITIKVNEIDDQQLSDFLGSLG